MPAKTLKVSLEASGVHSRVQLVTVSSTPYSLKAGCWEQLLGGERWAEATFRGPGTRRPRGHTWVSWCSRPVVDLLQPAGPHSGSAVALPCTVYLSEKGE